jgi:hypothetical protein
VQVCMKRISARDGEIGRTAGDVCAPLCLSSLLFNLFAPPALFCSLSLHPPFLQQHICPYLALLHPSPSFLFALRASLLLSGALLFFSALRLCFALRYVPSLLFRLCAGSGYSIPPRSALHRSRTLRQALATLIYAVASKQ